MKRTPYSTFDLPGCSALGRSASYFFARAHTNRYARAVRTG